MNDLLALDQQLFLFLNSLHAAWLDPIMIAVSGKLTWIPLYLLIVYLVYRNQQWRGLLWFVVCAGLVVLLADRISVLAFKDIFQRLRPCHEASIADYVYLPSGHKGGLYGFVSSHAANTFGIAVLTALFLQKRWATLLLLVWALWVSYSRIYMGVHYPGDVLCGAILGAGIASAIWLAARALNARLIAPKRHSKIAKNT